MTTSLTGGCLCGAVRFELTAQPTLAGYCHCTRCQRRTGTGSSAQTRVDAGALRIVSDRERDQNRERDGGADQGGGRLTWWRHPDGGFEKGFCNACGGHLFSRNPDDHRQLNVRLAAFDTDPGVRPSYRAWVAFAAPWEPIPDDGLPRHDERLPPGWLDFPPKPTDS